MRRLSWLIVRNKGYGEYQYKYAKTFEQAVDIAAAMRKRYGLGYEINIKYTVTVNGTDHLLVVRKYASGKQVREEHTVPSPDNSQEWNVLRRVGEGGKTVECVTTDSYDKAIGIAREWYEKDGLMYGTYIGYRVNEINEPAMFKYFGMEVNSVEDIN